MYKIWSLIIEVLSFFVIFKIRKRRVIMSIFSTEENGPRAIVTITRRMISADHSTAQQLES